MSNKFYNKLHKAIDEYWESKYRTFAKGRIKRMRSGKDKGLGWCNVKTIRKIASPKLIYKTYYYQGAYPTITRWNRH